MKTPNAALDRMVVLDYHLGYSLRDIQARCGVSRSTIYRILERHDIEVDRKAEGDDDGR